MAKTESFCVKVEIKEQDIRDNALNDPVKGRKYALAKIVQGLVDTNTGWEIESSFISSTDGSINPATYLDSDMTDAVCVNMINRNGYKMQLLWGKNIQDSITYHKNYNNIIPYMSNLCFSFLTANVKDIFNEPNSSGGIYKNNNMLISSITNSNSVISFDIVETAINGSTNNNYIFYIIASHNGSQTIFVLNDLTNTTSKYLCGVSCNINGLCYPQVDTDTQKNMLFFSTLTDSNGNVIIEHNNLNNNSPDDTIFNAVFSVAETNSSNSSFELLSGTNGSVTSGTNTYFVYLTHIINNYDNINLNNVINVNGSTNKTIITPLNIGIATTSSDNFFVNGNSGMKGYLNIQMISYYYNPTSSTLSAGHILDDGYLLSIGNNIAINWSPQNKKEVNPWYVSAT